jgi:hypothetical protein
MDKGFKKRLLGLIVLFIILIIGMIPFVVTFHNSQISESISDWGNFGSYFSSILTLINIVVFIYITFLIGDLDDKRSKSQIEAQYKITLTQFRQNELDKLNTKLDSIFEGTDEKKEKIINRFVLANKYLIDFSNQKKYLFPIIGVENNTKLINEIQLKLSQLLDLLNEINSDNYTEEELNEKLMTKVQVIIILKNKLIDKFQNYILDELK